MKKYYQKDNQVPFETVKYKWLQHKLRDLLFINCTFESTAILSKNTLYYLRWKMMKQQKK